MKVAAEHIPDGVSMKAHLFYYQELIDLFRQIRPKKIIETGTYLGEGSTKYIGEAIKETGLKNVEFFSIECNPVYYNQAKQRVDKNKTPVQLVLGLSVPRALLPSKEQIQVDTVDVDDEHLFVDHNEEQRIELYCGETNFADVPDDCLGKVLSKFGGKPDFVLLDSAGHLGFYEFQYLISKLQGECYIALDDIYHVKHNRSFNYAKQDSRFEVVFETKEKFGFCILRYNPKVAGLKPKKYKILFKYPTKGRPDWFIATLNKYYDMMSGKHNFEFIISLNANDKSMLKVSMRKFMDSKPNLQYFYGKHKSKVEAINADIEKAKDWDILILIADDMEPIVQGYDDVIVRNMLLAFPDCDGCIDFLDAFQGSKLDVLPIMGRSLYEHFGYIYHPLYKSTVCDVEFTKVIKSMGKYRYYPDMIIEHNHRKRYTYDDIYLKNERDETYDRAIYFRRRRLGFPIQK